MTWKEEFLLGVGVIYCIIFMETAGETHDELENKSDLELRGVFPSFFLLFVTKGTVAYVHLYT